jgi:hypothetical protein
MSPACWFQTRDKLGLLANWPNDGTYEKFAKLDLLPSVHQVKTHQRFAL